MSPTPPETTPPRPVAPLRQAFNALASYTHDLLTRLRTARAGQPTQHPLPDAFATNHKAVQRRVTTALHWLLALALTLRGDITYLKKYRFKSHNLPTPPNPSQPPMTAAELEHRRAANRHAAEVSRIRASFTRDPIGAITAGICRRLDIQPGHKLYPAHLIAITQTPGQWAHRVIAARLRAILEPLGLTEADAMPHDILLAVYGPTLRPLKRPRPPH